MWRYLAFAQTAASDTDSRLLHVESWDHWTSNLTQYAHEVATDTLERVARTDRCSESTARHTRVSVTEAHPESAQLVHSQREQTAARRAQPREHESEVRATRVRAIRKRNNKVDKYNNYLSSWLKSELLLKLKNVLLDDASKQQTKTEK